MDCIDLRGLADSDLFPLLGDFDGGVRLAADDDVVLHELDGVVFGVCFAWAILCIESKVLLLLLVVDFGLMTTLDALHNLVALKSILVNLQITDLYQGFLLVMTRVDGAKTHREVDIADIVRPDIAIVILEAWGLGNVDWIFIAFLLFIWLD